MRSLTENTAQIKVNAKAGKNHYIWQEVKIGMWTARSQLPEVGEEKGKKEVKDRTLIALEI
jgi:hypothetical protein